MSGHRRSDAPAYPGRILEGRRLHSTQVDLSSDGTGSNRSGESRRDLRLDML